ncbi:TrbI/VirB10 family protein [Ramlibacter sp. AN1133]|uniref:TrbI/VirB10 family protein n=1 Tax=Ramlibacter sp. AN1133 TaxID=3133429 RepID=UPI0030C29607
MAISDKTILDPEPSQPGVPLRKSTLAVLAALVLALAFVCSLVLSHTAPAPQAPSAARDLREWKKTGTDQMLKDEEAQAARTARVAGAAAARASGATAPLPLAMPAIPAGVRRMDDSSAFFDRKTPLRMGAAPAAAPAAPLRSGEKDLEFEAQTRMAKALVADLEAPHEDPRATGAGRAGPGWIEAPALPAAASATPAPSAAIAGQIEAFAQQLRLAQAAPGVSLRSRDDWVREYARDGAARSRVLAGYQAATRLVLRQGKVIPAVLGRQINSDLPGRITAYVSSNVYDSDGRLLIPMGAALIGKYDSGVLVGQSRLMFAFERLVLPNGYSFDLPAAAGADLAGAAGMAGAVDNHFLKMFGTSLLIAVLADRGKQPASVTQLGSSGPVTAAGQVLADVSKTALDRNRVIAPTLTVDQGTRINVEVVSDMVFPQHYPLEQAR